MTISVLWGMPLVWMVSTSLKPEGQIMRYPIEWLPRQVSLENYQIVFNYPVLRWFWNSLFVAVATTALVVLFSAMAGYALARMRFWGRGFVFGVILSSRMIPGAVALIPLYLIIARFRLLDTYLALIMPAVASTLGVYLFRQFFLFTAPRIGGRRPDRWMRALWPVLQDRASTGRSRPSDGLHHYFCRQLGTISCGLFWSRVPTPQLPCRLV